jgi:hypothetical protein
MIDHLAVDVSDLKKSGHFYDNALEPLGYTKLMEAPQEFGGRLCLVADSRVFDPPNPNELTHPFRDY